jgi:hypothetical protein
MINDKNSLNKIVGTRELRAKLSSFLDSVINNGTEITTGHIKKKIVRLHQFYQRKYSYLC